MEVIIYIMVNMFIQLIGLMYRVFAVDKVDVHGDWIVVIVHNA